MPIIEELGFNSNHRKEMRIDDEIVEVNQTFPDISFPNNKIKSLSVEKLISGTIKSQQITLDIVDGEGDIYIAGGTFDAATWTATGGFILGLDDSDSNVEKFFIGDATTSIDWNVTTVDTLTIKGVITATSGSIGGWTINSDSLTASSGEVGISSAITAGDDIRFWAGDAIPASAEFRVYESGAVVASSITATGTINAQGGYIGAASTALAIENAGLNIGNTGSIRGGQTAYDTGSGWFLGYSSSAYKLSIGDGTLNNSLKWDGTDLYVKGTQLLFNDVFGSGKDGDVTISADTTLTSDMFYDNLTVDVTKTLNTGGFRVFVKGTLTLNGTIARNGNAGGNGGSAVDINGGSGGTGGAALADGSIKGTIAGVNGGQGGAGGGNNPGNFGAAGSNGNDVAKSLGDNGVVGVSGGNGGRSATFPAGNPGGSGGAGGTAGSQTGTVYNQPYSIVPAYNLYDELPAGDYLKSSAGSGASGGGGGGGGSSGSGGGGGGGGGSGSPGGIVFLFAKTIIGSGTISAVGGNGGNGGAGRDGISGNGGGGGGGGAGSGSSGGVIIFGYNSKTAITVSAAGGSAGNVGNYGAGVGTGLVGVAGTTGNAGNTGTIIYLQV